MGRRSVHRILYQEMNRDHLFFSFIWFCRVQVSNLNGWTRTYRWGLDHRPEQWWVVCGSPECRQRRRCASRCTNPATITTSPSIPSRASSQQPSARFERKKTILFTIITGSRQCCLNRKIFLRDECDRGCRTIDRQANEKYRLIIKAATQNTAEYGRFEVHVLPANQRRFQPQFSLDRYR